jgi:hypothetical protein
MKGIYLTQEGKQEIADYESGESYDDELYEMKLQGRYESYKEILASATILPVKSNMSYVKSYDFVDEFDIEYPNGVIIQPK